MIIKLKCPISNPLTLGVSPMTNTYVILQF